MGLVIEAIYVDGVLKPPRELPLENGLAVRVTHPTIHAAVIIPSTIADDLGYYVPRERKRS